MLLFVVAAGLQAWSSRVDSVHLSWHNLICTLLSLWKKPLPTTMLSSSEEERTEVSGGADNLLGDLQISSLGGKIKVVGCEDCGHCIPRDL